MARTTRAHRSKRYNDEGKHTATMVLGKVVCAHVNKEVYDDISGTRNITNPPFLPSRKPLEGSDGEAGTKQPISDRSVR